MNESILAIIVGGIIGFIFIMLPAIIVRAVYRRFRTSKVKTHSETLITKPQQEPYPPSTPPSGLRTAINFTIMTLVVLGWGLVAGFVNGIFSQIIPIILVYTIVMAINSGKMIVDAVQRAQVRTVSQLVFLSLLSAVSMYGMYHYCQYLGFQLQASVEIFEGLSEATEEENFGVATSFLDYALEEETGHSGFIGYMLYTANQGMSIGRFYRSDSIHLGPVLTWLFWFLEFGIIFGVTIQKGKQVVGRSFCEACGNWHGSEKHLGGTASANESVLLGMLKQKDFTGLGTLIEKNAELPSLELYLNGCQVCGQSQSQLVVRRAFQSAKGGLQFTDAAQANLQPNESVLLLNQLSFSGN